METHYFNCACSDFNHTFRFTLDTRDGDVYLDVRMNYAEPWWQRVWNAIKYVCGLDVAYGHYDCTILKDEDYNRIRDLLTRSELTKAGCVARTREQLLIE